MILYKYLPSIRIDILEHQLLRFTQPTAFNDPFDSHPFVDDQGKTQNLWEKLSPEEKRELPDEHTFKQIALSVTQRLNSLIEHHWYREWSSKVGILCLSEVNDSLLMWAHYADAYKGFVIGIDTVHPAFEHTKGKCPLRKVQYSRDRPDVPPNRGGPPASEIYFTKGTDWEYEQEWRIVRPLSEASDKLDNDIYRFTLPLPVIRELILGFRLGDQTMDRIFNLLIKSEHQRKVKIGMVTKNARAYCVDINFIATVVSDGWSDV